MNMLLSVIERVNVPTDDSVYGLSGMIIHLAIIFFLQLGLSGCSIIRDPGGGIIFSLLS
jgi:hypothetical protein